MPSHLTFTGLAELERRLGQEIEDIHTRAASAVREEAETILSNTHPPIETGALDASGHVESYDENNEITSTITYGGDEAPYAPFVHEMPGDGHKFLERPLVEAEKGMLNRMAGRIRK